jgi:hypothetical protein
MIPLGETVPIRPSRPEPFPSLCLAAIHDAVVRQFELHPNLDEELYGFHLPEARKNHDAGALEGLFGFENS